MPLITFALSLCHISLNQTLQLPTLRPRPLNQRLHVPPPLSAPPNKKWRKPNRLRLSLTRPDFNSSPSPPSNTYIILQLNVHLPSKPQCLSSQSKSKYVRKSRIVASDFTSTVVKTTQVGPLERHSRLTAALI